MGRFYVERNGASTPIREPDEIKPFLGAAHHWKAGRSAQELAYAWMGRDCPPKQVKAVLHGAPEWVELTVSKGFFEHQTAIDSRSGPSQTDLLLLTDLVDGLGTIGVEGKVDEDFGELTDVYVAKSLTRNPRSGVAARVDELCAHLGIDRSQAGGLRYQLLHRTVAVLVEAESRKARHAMMLVHSFAVPPQEDHFADFAAFAAALGAGEVSRNGVSVPLTVRGQSLRLAWASDKPRE